MESVGDSDRVRERVCVCFRGWRCERVEGALAPEYLAFLVAILFQCVCVREREREGGREGERRREKEREKAWETTTE